MNVYGEFALLFKVFDSDRDSVISWPSEVFVRSGDRRRAMGAIGDGLFCEGMLVSVLIGCRIF